MAKFNEKNTAKTTNREGLPAYRMGEREQLVTAVLTTMLGEPKFYGSTDSDIFILGSKAAREDPEFLYRLARYARNEANLRSVSHVLCCIIARDGRKYTRPAVRDVVRRPDDITEIMACWLKMYGKPFPNAMKREIANVIQQFNEYSLAKYNRRNGLKFKDVLRITHPRPKDPETEALFRKVLDGTLETPYTWETELSARGNTAEVWNELIASGKVGYMALLRNLSNIIESGADVSPVLKVLSDPARIRESRQMPFRFFSAYRMLGCKKLLTDEITRALETAITVSTEGMETIPGRTLVAVDTSGSMASRVSRRTNVMCRDIACLLGAMSGRLCEDAEICWFDQARTEYWPHYREYKGYQIGRCARDENILEFCLNSPEGGGGTDLSLPLKYALEEDPRASERPFDRIIYFSDNMCNTRLPGNTTVQDLADRYRRKYNPELWVHAVDLMGYGTQQFRGERFNVIAGWSEFVLPFILIAEKGIGSLAEYIASGGKTGEADAR